MSKVHHYMGFKIGSSFGEYLILPGSETSAHYSEGEGETKTESVNFF